ncbi:MAG: ribonuclease HI [Firmicutes bacterium]|nr:ribonuclease HI [Bacillota bacterium]
MAKQEEVIIYTDGGCRGNGKTTNVGGYGAVLIHPASGKRKEISAGFRNVTNNQMELQGVIAALSQLKRPAIVHLYTDSAYIHNAFTQGWIEKWQKNNWLTSTREPVKNRELWEEIIRLTHVHQIHWHKVKGHADNEENNRADELANQAMDQLEQGL